MKMLYKNWMMGEFFWDNEPEDPNPEDDFMPELELVPEI